MGILIYNPPAPSIRTEYAPVVFTREAWGDDWEFQPELVPQEISVRVASDGISRCTLARHFGAVKEPWESAVLEREPWSGGNGTWVMIALSDGQGYEAVFHGQIIADSRRLGGSDNGAMGMQTWPVRGPLDLLRRHNVSSSTWYDGSEVKTMQWIPPLNRHGVKGTIIGNRSASKPELDFDNSFHYGGDYEWNYLHYLDYIFANFVNDPDDETVPQWTIGGQTSILMNLTEPVKFEATQTVADIVARLIQRQRGMDYSVVTTDEGFELRVFSLNDKPVSFGSTLLPGNPHRVDFDSEQGDDFDIRVAESDEENYGKIRVLGKPLVVCCSLNGSLTEVADQILGVTTLAAGWSTSLQDDYDNHTNLDEPASTISEMVEAAKKYRQKDKFRTVYRVFTATADFQNAGEVITPTVTPAGGIDDVTPADYQYKVRSTLSWVPMYENVTYGEFEDQDRTTEMYATESGEKQPELLPPMAWVGPASDDQPEENEPRKYVPVEKIGANVAPLKNHLGLYIEASPNHLLAPSSIPFTEIDAYHDWNYMIVTLAFESDQRLYLEYDVPEADTDLVKDVTVDAEAWWMAAGTCVGLDDSNEPIRTFFAREMRNDRAKMEAAMVGAIARYGTPRNRATIEFQGIALWGSLLGSILDTVTSGGIPHRIRAPITSVTWTFPSLDSEDGESKTVVNTGYAR